MEKGTFGSVKNGEEMMETPCIGNHNFRLLWKLVAINHPGLQTHRETLIYINEC